ncbi:UPF0728 protein [Strongylocentrotus purpuratus]|uniref:Uncharacterized protein n=1 Tax=Strongylocentrotus purpuratus TaxID=7668 RepID=A0A7M7NE53_STRPU|nr:UPF0728 protein-like [Strongylocentrotus purpuratus]XP_800037.1 UPF0728 protein [Strongylocentrotus purpuratus]|eukprot:XP_800037.1 PREDICTED: UPF0728 protein [Strongylocentrotus purpuratus]
MPENTVVTVRYGPYHACGVTAHRAQRLSGLRALLEENGHTVELEEIKDWNVIELIVNGEQVYNCDILELDYGGDGKLDDHCHKALEAVQKAY